MAPALVLFNTLTRSKDVFVPQEPGKVKLYTCGPTVYHYAHIGNLRTYVFEDVLVRTLRYFGYAVEHVMNITDVGHLVSDADEGEDKMEKGARREGKTAWDIAEFYTRAFLKDLERLNVTPPPAKLRPKATDYIKEMIALVEQLEKKGFTYRTSDGIYYDTSKFPGYGKLARLDLENLDAGHRVDMRDKKHPTDFALWKFSAPNEKRQMEWPSPWGVGFPGWHIECSAMAMALLGETLDIHCGGKDHIPVHHTNEIAQSEAVTNRQFSRWWMHGEFLTEDKGKMSKSAGEFLTLDALIAQGYDPLAYRFLLLQAHYRSEINFHWDAVKAAQAGLEGIRNRFADWGGLAERPTDTPGMRAYRERFAAAVADDLNTPIAVSVLFDVLRDAKLANPEKQALAREFDTIFGLGFEKDILKAEKGEEWPETIAARVAARDAARLAKNWAESDRLRDELVRAGYEVLDTPKGTRLKKR